MGLLQMETQTAVPGDVGRSPTQSKRIRQSQFTMDDFAQQFLDSPDTEEALDWLRAATPEHFRSLGEHDSTEESIALVEELYAAGAAKVLAVDIDRDDDGDNTGKLLIELSDDSADRDTVLTIVGKIAESQGFDAETDTGQRHVFVMLD